MPIIQQLMGIPSFGAELGRTLGGGVSQGLQKSLEDFQLQKLHNQKVQKFIDLGYPEDLAELQANVPKGGETAIVKEVLELRKRGIKPGKESEEPEEESVEDLVRQFDEGLTPSERIRRQSERYKTNLPVYQQATEKLRGLNRDKERLDILDNLNKSGKLPKSFGRFNVDKEGNLRLPFAASPESQRYIKTLNEFSAGAKDTFGSRVTNFDLQQFMMRFPTLLNTEEGRTQISKQMGIVNRINSTYYRNLKKVYDRAGGVRKIDADLAESLAEKMSEGEISDLVAEFDKIGQDIIEKNEPSDSKVAFNPETGEKLQLKDGKWQPIQ